MKSLLCSLLMAATLGVVFTAQPWWKTAVFYELYPRSFMDYSNDGIGDLKGVISKVDYFAELGITSLYLAPFYSSPMADLGYDVSNYRDVDPMFGNLTDFSELITAFHAKDIKVIVDFVPNHSSDEHPWFNKSINMEGNYTNYYVWRNASAYVNGTPVVPNNWGSAFAGSMWEWNEKRQQYYLHQFLAKQPDLNYRDENLVKEMKDILNFWLDLGVDGFRVDAVKYLVEDGRFEDVNNSMEVFGFPINPYTQNQNMTYDIVNEWSQLIKERIAADSKDRIFFLENYDTVAMVNTYNGGPDYPFTLPFNFVLQTGINEGTNATELWTLIKSWLDAIPESATPNWLVGSHDQSRLAEKAGAEMVDATNMMLAMLPGIMTTYYGEEIGMQDTYVSSGTQQRSGNGMMAQSTSRDPERTPLQWDDSENAGFCKNATPWLPLNPNYWWLNVAAQKVADRSHLKVYQSVMKLRKTATFTSDVTQYSIIATDDITLGILRSAADTDEKYLLVMNLGSALNRPLTTTFLRSFQLDAVTQFTVHTASVNSGYNQSEKISTLGGLTLRPKAAVILHASSGKVSSASTLVTSITLLCIALFVCVFS